MIRGIEPSNDYNYCSSSLPLLDSIGVLSCTLTVKKDRIG